MLKLYIGNKNYSSWSMRPWVLLRQAGIEFQEIMVRFDSFDPGSQFRQTMGPISPTGKVPVLVDTEVNGGLVVWDTLAIAEYLAEKFSHLNLWPVAPSARAQARSVCAEMHAGFSALRSACPMNVEAQLPDIGRLVWRDKPAVRADVTRLCQMWSGLLGTHGGPMLFGEFSVADAYYAPVVTRLVTYGLPVPEDIAAYVARVLALPGVRAWLDEARAEHDFVVFDEPYRLQG